MHVTLMCGLLLFFLFLAGDAQPLSFHSPVGDDEQGWASATQTMATAMGQGATRQFGKQGDGVSDGDLARRLRMSLPSEGRGKLTG